MNQAAIDGVIVFNEAELHWLVESLRRKIAEEEFTLRFLEATYDLCENVSEHRARIAAQEMIVRGHRTLLGKIGEVF